MTLKRAGITGLHLHDLRGEVASRMAESGAPPHEVRDLLGHSSTAVTDRYFRSSPYRLKASIDRMEAMQTQSHTPAPPDVSTLDAPEAPAPPLPPAPASVN